MKALIFRRVEDKIYPDKQLVGTFFVSDYLMDKDVIEVRPLTIEQLIFSIARNYWRIGYWAFVRGLWKLGFVDTPPGLWFSWKQHFRWIPDRRRARKSDELQR